MKNQEVFGYLIVDVCNYDDYVIFLGIVVICFNIGDKVFVWIGFVYLLIFYGSGSFFILLFIGFLFYQINYFVEFFFKLFDLFLVWIFNILVEFEN